MHRIKTVFSAKQRSWIRPLQYLTRNARNSQLSNQNSFSSNNFFLFQTSFDWWSFQDTREENVQKYLWT